MLLSPYPTTAERIRVGALCLWCAFVLVFLVAPILVPVPLSFNSGSFFTFPLAGLSTRWYETVLGTARWRNAIGNSVLIGTGATILATVLGTMTAMGLSDPRFPARRLVVPLLISPLIVPIVVTAVGTYLFYARMGLVNTYAGIILAHTVIASPFVVVTVGASLTGFDRNLMRAASILGARPLTGFFRVMLPLILPGVLSGAAFAFVTSFDEVVIVQFLANADQRTLPLEMFTGLREQLSPAITAAATLMMTLSILLLIVANLLARRSRKRAAVIPEAAGAIA
jgi:putative spermidine/putrescine transport system permease protein